MLKCFWSLKKSDQNSSVLAELIKILGNENIYDDRKVAIVNAVKFIKKLEKD